MRIARDLIDEIVAHAREERPKECCGVIAARGGEAVKVFRTRNASGTPRFGYVMDGVEQYRVQTEIEDAGLELGAIYHSHPKTAPLPSQADINLAMLGDSGQPAYPGTLYVIVGFEDPSSPEVRAWRIDGPEQVSEARLDVV